MGAVDVSPIVLDLDSEHPLIDLVIAAGLEPGDKSMARIEASGFRRVDRNSSTECGPFVSNVVTRVAPIAADVAAGQV